MQPPRHFAVLLKSAVWESVCYKAILSPTNHSHHPEQMFEHPTPHRLLKLSSSCLEFHLRFLLLKPNGKFSKYSQGDLLSSTSILFCTTDITWPLYRTCGVHSKLTNSQIVLDKSLFLFSSWFSNASLIFVLSLTHANLLSYLKRLRLQNS